MDYIPTECGALDAMLGGGIETSCITLLYGEAGTGKTNLCLVLARNVARSGKKVIYVDSEGVSIERLRQISGKDYEEVTKNVLSPRCTRSPSRRRWWTRRSSWRRGTRTSA